MQAAKTMVTDSRFLLTPLREGRRVRSAALHVHGAFLLTPLREGRQELRSWAAGKDLISTHAPAGVATPAAYLADTDGEEFLLTPLREGRRRRRRLHTDAADFYSRPCGRGDDLRPVFFRRAKHFYSRPCGRGDLRRRHDREVQGRISTHAPAGGATRTKLHSLRKLFKFLLTPLREGRRQFSTSPS